MNAPATPPTTPPAIAPTLADEDELGILDSIAGTILVGVVVELDDVGVCEGVVAVVVAEVDMVEVGVATIRIHVGQQTQSMKTCFTLLTEEGRPFRDYGQLLRTRAQLRHITHASNVSIVQLKPPFAIGATKVVIREIEIGGDIPAVRMPLEQSTAVCWCWTAYRTAA